MGFFACGGNAIQPGHPTEVAEKAGSAYASAGHVCQMKGEVAYCDMSGSGLPLLIGYDANRKELVFVSIVDTDALFTRPCNAMPDLAHPSWIVVKCNAIEQADKTNKVVMSIIGGGKMPSEGMTPDEVIRSARLFVDEAERYVLRLKDRL